jgi:rapamycin-insensitive companion of mTOR
MSVFYRLRQFYPDSFKRVDLYYSVCQLLGSYHFRSPVRKYVLEIFDMRFTTELLHELDEISATTTQCITFTCTNNSDTDEKHKVTPSNTTNSTSAIMNPNDKIPKEKLEPKNVKLGFHIASSSS